MARLSIQLMDTFRVTLDGDPVVGFASDKVRALLAYLAVEGAQPQRRETLAGLLWGGYPERSARASLRNALANLRDVIGDREAQPPYLRITPQAIQLYPEGDVWVDAAVFTQLVDGTGSPQPRRERQTDRLEAAVSLYQGSFLKGFSLADSPAFEEWALLVREQLQRRMLTALQALVEQYERRGEVARGLEYARREVELEPYPEAAQRQLMRLLAANGQRELALAQYERYCRLLKADLGVAPGQETVRLYEDIRDGQDLTGTPNLSGLSGNPLHNLPVLPTPTVGREGTLAEIETLLGDGSCRLVTLTGSGGIGKTRLAIEVARQRAGGYADGTYFVPLVGLSSSSGIVPAIAQAMGLVFDDQWDPAQQLLRALRGKEMLLVLDNYEHLLADADGPTAFVSDLLGTAVGVQVLVTSRERLNVRGEQVYVVQGMDYPAQDLAGFPPDSHRRPVRSVLRCSAVQLYLQQARRVRSDFEPSDEALAQIGRVCRMVEGMPLAIELAAAWMDVLSPGEIAGELERSIAFLRSDLRDLPERHRSMVAAFDVSWGMLSETEREAFAALSVFRGGCTREAAEAVAGADLEILRALVLKSFLTRDENGRYQVHELLRQYGEAKLRERPEEWERVLDRHCAYYARWMDQQGFPAGGEAATVLPEIDNIRTGWSRAVRAPRFAELRQYRGVAWLYELSGRSAEAAAVFGWADESLRTAYAQGLDRDQTIAVAVALQVVSLAVRRIDKQKSISLLQEAVALLRSVDAREELALIHGMIVKAGLIGYGAEARQLLEESVSAFREMGNDVQVADELNNLAEFALRVGDCSSAERYCREALQIGEATGNRRVTAWSLETVGKAAYARGRYDVAVRYVQRSLALLRQLGYQRQIAIDCSLLGEAHYAAGALADAAACHWEAVSLWLHRGSLWRRMASGEYHGAVYSLCRLGDICLAQGDAAEAEQRYGEALHAAVDGEPAAVLYAVVRQGELLAREGQLAPAAELAALVAEHPESIPEAKERALALLAEVGERLSPQELVAVQEHGEAMSLDEAVAELLREPGK